MQKESKTIYHRGAISWMANNPVAANIFMLFLLVGGLFWGLQIKQEVFPEFSIDQVDISVIYPGASPDEIEKGIAAVGIALGNQPVGPFFRFPALRHPPELVKYLGKIISRAFVVRSPRRL